ncbi:unnamed protein product [Rodentolepis nana]|uniref:Uncharacterized protein n=1 Tax=Rodentolepis nana TaxID=102285 RepID=A0A0R3TVH1_RODNA|nr:unnamed protein product [Rodentolepis nana]
MDDPLKPPPHDCGRYFMTIYTLTFVMIDVSRKPQEECLLPRPSHPIPFHSSPLLSLSPSYLFQSQKANISLPFLQSLTHMQMKKLACKGKNKRTSGCTCFMTHCQPDWLPVVACSQSSRVQQLLRREKRNKSDLVVC